MDSDGKECGRRVGEMMTLIKLIDRSRENVEEKEGGGLGDPGFDTRD